MAFKNKNTSLPLQCILLGCSAHPTLFRYHLPPLAVFSRRLPHRWPLDSNYMPPLSELSAVVTPLGPRVSHSICLSSLYCRGFFLIVASCSYKLCLCALYCRGSFPINTTSFRVLCSAMEKVAGNQCSMSHFFREDSPSVLCIVAARHSHCFA